MPERSQSLEPPFGLVVTGAPEAIQKPDAGLGRRVVGGLRRLATRLKVFLPGQQADSEEDPDRLQRTGGVVSRWMAFPRSAQAFTAALTAGGSTALWAAAATDGLFVPAAILGTSWLVGSAGPIGLRLANRRHRRATRYRRRRVMELRSMADGEMAAVRGVVVPRRTGASALDSRAAVWSLTRFDSWGAAGVFHEVAFDFLVDDGTDEPLLVEVSGGLIINRFPPRRRVQFQNTTLLEIDHPFLTRLRLRGKQVQASEINVTAGDVVEVVGCLSHAVDPTAHAESRETPQRRSLRSAAGQPLMLRRLGIPDVELGRVRRLLPRRPPEASAGEPPILKF